jgi:hypothetical protein
MCIYRGLWHSRVNPPLFPACLVLGEPTVRTPSLVSPRFGCFVGFSLNRRWQRGSRPCLETCELGSDAPPTVYWVVVVSDLRVRGSFAWTGNCLRTDGSEICWLTGGPGASWLLLVTRFTGRRFSPRVSLAGSAVRPSSGVRLAVSSDYLGELPGWSFQ